MTKEMDESLFEDVEYGTTTEMDESLFENVEYGKEPFDTDQITTPVGGAVVGALGGQAIKKTVEKTGELAEKVAGSKMTPKVKTAVRGAASSKIPILGALLPEELVTEAAEKIEPKLRTGGSKISRLIKSSPSSKALKSLPVIGGVLGGLLGYSTSRASGLSEGESLGEAFDITGSERLEATPQSPEWKLERGMRLNPDEKQKLYGPQKKSRHDTTKTLSTLPIEAYQSASLRAQTELPEKDRERVSNLIQRIGEAEPEKRKAMLFGAMQHSYFRNLLPKMFEETSEEE